MTASDPAPAHTLTAGDRGMRRATLLGLVVAVVLALAMVALAAAIAERPAVLGALVGAALTVVVVAPTAVTGYLAPRLSPVTMAVTVLASWILKMVIVVVVLLMLRDVESVSIVWVGLTLLVGALMGVVIETVLLARVRRPLDVEPDPRPE